MMDEFELYRARAYGRDLGAPDRVLGSGEEASLLSSKSKRRHSSVGICRSDAESYNPFSVATVMNNFQSKQDAERSCYGSNADRWRNKPKLSSQVTVAIEPPSPTENNFDEYGRRFSSRSKHRKEQHPQLSEDDDDDDDDDNDDEEYEEEGDSAEIHFPPLRQNLQRTHTAPPSTRSPSPRRHRNPDSDLSVLDSNLASHQSIDSEMMRSKLQPSDEPFEYLRRSPSTKRGKSPQHETHGPRNEQSDRRDMRPDNLRLTASGAGGDGGMPRRKSVTCTMDSLRLNQPSPSTQRRNSYTGTVTLKPSSPPSAACSTGRRGSAITYLTDAPPVGGLGWRQSSPAGSPSRRKSCFEDIGRVSSGGLNPDEIRAHLEELTRAAEKATAAGRGRARGEGSKVNSRASSISHKTSKRTSVCGSGSGGSDSTESSLRPHIYRVLVLGGQGVGKTTLANQLMTSEYLANKENQQDVIDPEHMVCVRLDDEVAMVHIVESASDEGNKEQWPSEEVDAYLVIYSVTDRLSFSYAQLCIQNLGRIEATIVLVANKQDLVRNRVISTAEGKRLGLKRRCKFLEVSALLDHKVDEVLVTIIRECRSRQRKLDWEPVGIHVNEDLGCLRRVLDACSKLCK